MGQRTAIEFFGQLHLVAEQYLQFLSRSEASKSLVSCSLSVTTSATDTTETFNVEVFQDKFGTDVRMAGFLTELRRINSMKELVVLDHQSSPARLILVQDDLEVESPAAATKIAVAGVECFAELSFASISRALFCLSVAMLAVGSVEV